VLFYLMTCSRYLLGLQRQGPGLPFRDAVPGVQIVGVVFFGLHPCLGKLAERFGRRILILTTILHRAIFGFFYARC
jgi:hypothetical protein